MSRVTIWMAAAEAAPLAQVGGLADVLRALPPALQRAGATVRRFLPAYDFIPRGGFSPDGEMDVPFGGAAARVGFLTRHDADGLATTLVTGPGLGGDGGIYGGGALDVARRFILFSRAVAERARADRRPPEILHAHDWHAALVPLFVRLTDPWPRLARTVMTIHNMGYLGRYPAGAAEWLSLDPAALGRAMTPEGIEFHGDISLLKAGLVYADALTAVSPTYAREIATPAFGFGLEGLMLHRAAALTGILNGCDYDVWNPRTDPQLPVPFDAGDMAGKTRAREALLARLEMEPGEGALVGVLGRLAHQKGMDLVVEAAPRLIEAAKLAIVASGDAHLESSLAALRASRPGRMGLHLGYSDPLAHLLVAGADLILLPSRYEPCGLVQMNAMRYGTLPAVNPVGGLADTVVDELAAPGEGTGFHLDELSPAGIVRAVERALAIRATDPGRWSGVQQRAMRRDFSWDRAAGEYMTLYRRLLS